jgi:phospholipid/cholesterol/gamma-HCH transport system substrate-binding protein
MRAHFGFVLNSDDPHACISGYTSTGQTPSPGAVATTDTRRVACTVINGVDPNPGDGVDESGSDIRGAQNIGRSGGVGSNGPQSGLTGSTGVLSSSPLDEVLGGLLNANPFSRTVG